jgi:hypothetical protein
MTEELLMNPEDTTLKIDRFCMPLAVMTRIGHDDPFSVEEPLQQVSTATPEYVRSNAPCRGFAVVTSITIDGEEMLKPGEEIDAFAFTGNLPDSKLMLPKKKNLSHGQAIRVSGRLTGWVPERFTPGNPYLLTFSFFGAATLVYAGPFIDLHEPILIGSDARKIVIEKTIAEGEELTPRLITSNCPGPGFAYVESVKVNGTEIYAEHGCVTDAFSMQLCQRKSVNEPSACEPMFRDVLAAAGDKIRIDGYFTGYRPAEFKAGDMFLLTFTLHERAPT